MPASLTEAGQTSNWLYSPEHERTKLVTPGRSTWYLNPGVHQGAHYERTQYTSGSIEHRHTLYGGGRPIGEILSFDNVAPTQTRYFHSDIQGSLTAVTSETGAVLTRYKYDPWGKQSLIAGVNTGVDQTRQGHTGHEMLDGGLTHMNGRLYDPVLARFVSADPIVPAPYNLQSLNRYSYVLNNPLGYTDPSGYYGFEVSLETGRMLIGVFTIFTGAIIGPAVFQAGFWAIGGTVGTLTGSGLLGYGAGMLGGAALAGTATSLITTGSTRDWQRNAISAGLFSGVGDLGFAAGSWQNTLAHGVAGGIIGDASGGDFKSGFMAGAFSEWAGPRVPGSGLIGGTIKYAVLGGTASVIGGGKFANGARTGAFGYLYNCGMHPGTCKSGQFSDSPSGHEEEQFSAICRAGASGCTRDTVFPALLHCPTPGACLSSPLQTGQVTEFMGNKILHVVDMSNFAVFNITQPGNHIFDPGYVYRYVGQASGMIGIWTYGAGTMSGFPRVLDLGFFRLGGWQEYDNRIKDRVK